MTETSAPAVLARLLGDARSSNGSVLKLLGRMLWRQRRLTLPALACAALLALLVLLPPWLLARLIDAGFSGRETGLIAGVAVAILMIGLMDGMLSVARRLLAARAALSLRREMLLPAFGTMLRLPADSALARDQGVLGQSFEEVDRLAQGAGERLVELALGGATVLILLGAMLVVDWRIGLVVGAIAAALAGLHLAAARSLRAREAAWFEARSRHWSHLIEAVAYVETIRRTNAHAFAERRFADRVAHDNAAHLAVVRLSAKLDAAGRVAGGAIIAAVTLLAGLDVASGAASVGAFVLLLSIGGALTGPVLSMLKVMDDLQAMAISVSRMQALAQPPHEDLRLEPGTAGAGTGGIAVSELSFSYGPDNAAVLDRLSFALAPGERVALVGRSGLGKSTLGHLLLRALNGDRDIRLGDIPASRVPLGEWRRRVVVVPHAIDVFTGTVAENIALSNPDAARAAIVAAAERALLADDIEGMPCGYDTVLGQGGVELSAGQKQRLGLARASLLKPDVLILDESTSALDAATEARVLDALLQHHAGATILAITHRDSVAARMDRVLRLDKIMAASQREPEE